MHACMNCSKGSSALTMPKRLFENKKNTSLLLPFEKLQKKNDLNLVPDLFILLSVHPKWCVDGRMGWVFHINMRWILVGKLELNSVKENNLDKAQAWFRLS